MDKSDWRTALRAVGEDSVCIDLYVEPGSSRQVIGPYDPWRQRVHAKVKAPAMDRKANRELCALIGDVLGVAAANVRILRGATTRRKTVLAGGIGMEVAIEALAGNLDDEGESPR